MKKSPLDLLRLAAARAGGDVDLDRVLADVADRRAQIWFAANSVAVTEIHDTPRRRVCHILLAAGTDAELRQMERDAAAWARTQGCTAMTQTGRRGWLRRLSARGWRPTLTTMERSL